MADIRSRKQITPSVNISTLEAIHIFVFAEMNV